MTVASDASQDLVRASAVITVWNTVSRLTGFVRVLAVGAALGTTFVGNTYQSANLVSNLLFELLAAGLLSAPLVPAFVALGDAGRHSEAERLAGSLLTFSLVALGAVALAGMLAAPVIMRALTARVGDTQVRQAEVRLGALWLWFFLPQVVLYGVGALASALLHARRRFAAAAFAPVANNVVVIATMAVFWSLRGGAGHLQGAAGLHLSTAQRLVLGAGTTAGVLAMVAVPVVALARSGARLRPRPVRRDDAQLRAVGRVGLWGAVFLGATQVLVATTLVLANQVQGGVVAYQIAFTFFLLPHAVLAHPVFTALYPRLAAHGVAGRWGEFADQLGSGIRLTAFLVLPAAAVLAAVSGPLLRLVRVGALDAAGVALVARVLTAYLAGLAGYAMLLLLVRAATAAGRARAAAGVGLAMAVAGAGLMVVAAGLTSGTDRVVALALAHSAVVTAGAVALFAVLRRRVGVAVPVGATLARSVVASAAGGLAAWLVAGLVPSGAGIVHAAAAVALGGGAGLVAVVAGQAALRAPELAWRRPAPAAP